MLELNDQDQLWLELDNSPTGSCSECLFLSCEAISAGIFRSWNTAGGHP